MARPETTDEVTDRRVLVATFHTEDFIASPVLVKQYGAFIGAAADAGHEAEKSYGSVTIYRPKTDDELEDALKSKQTTWDYRQKAYDRAASEPATRETLKDYEIKSVQAFARDEDLTDPFATDLEIVVKG